MKPGHGPLAAKCFPYLLLAALAATACAETYTWTDDNGMHFTDNLGSVPKKYREQAVAKVRDAEVPSGAQVIDVNENPELVISSQPGGGRQRGPKKAKQFQRGERLAIGESVGVDKKDGCFLNYFFEPGPSVHWTSNSYSSGAMRLKAGTEADCLRDCRDNAQDQALSRAKGWMLLGSCYYYGQKLSSDIKF